MLKNVVLTGGARGIGKVIARRLLQEKFNVFICSRHLSEVQHTCNELDSSGKRIDGLQADVSLERDCQKIVTQARNRFGSVDILINNAGIYGPIGSLESNNLADWLQTIQVNLMSMVFLSHEILPEMKKRNEGCIINMAGAGVGGKKPKGKFTAYYTSKTAVVGFTEALAAELRETAITVNCISPGGVNTHFTQYLLSQDPAVAGEELYNQALEQVKKGGDSPELTADMIIFLLSKKGRSVSGKFLSAKWDTHLYANQSSLTDDIFTLRRIDNTLFYDKDQ